MEAAIDKAVTVSGGHPEVHGVAALMARTLLWVVREDRVRALGELDAGMELLRGTPVTAPNRGLWALVHALDGSDGEAAVIEVERVGPDGVLADPRMGGPRAGGDPGPARARRRSRGGFRSG